MAKAYIKQNLEFKFMSSKEASDWLGERLAEQRKQVETSEQALQRYREQTDSVSLEEKQNIVVQKLSELNAAVTRAKTERIQKEAAYNQIRSLQNDRATLDTIPAILSNTFIQQQKSALADLQRQQAQLSDKLGPRHPDMMKIGLAIETAEAKIQGEISKVVQAMGNDYQQSLTQERSLTTALDQQKQDALALNRKGIEYGVLARDAASNRQIFESLMQRTKETGISGALKTSNIRVVDAAETPRGPVTPNTRNNLLLALFGGATLAIGLAFFFEYFSESFRGVRTNLLFSSADEGSRSVVITSTGPSEGKTVVATNLAVALAQAGQRVLLVDAHRMAENDISYFEIARTAIGPGSPALRGRQTIDRRIAATPLYLAAEDIAIHAGCPAGADPGARVRTPTRRVPDRWVTYQRRAGGGCHRHLASCRLQGHQRRNAPGAEDRERHRGQQTGGCGLSRTAREERFRMVITQQVLAFGPSA